MKVCTVLLAAGEGRRFGAGKGVIKQLAMVDGKPLISRVLNKYRSPEMAQGLFTQSLIAQTFVVLGANAEKISPLLPADVTPLIAPDWQKGMGHSLAYAVSQLPADTGHVLVALADQLAIEVSDIQQLIAASQQSPQQLVAAFYKGVSGVPAIFPRAFFPQLCALDGDRGARGLLRANANTLITVDMPRAAIDIDTQEDLKRWNDIR